MLAATLCFIYLHMIHICMQFWIEHVVANMSKEHPSSTNFQTSMVPNKFPQQLYIPKLKVHCLKHSIVSSFWSITKGHLVSPELLTSEVKPPNAFQDCWVGLAWILLLIPAHNYCMAGPIYQYKIILICISLKLNMVKILRFTVILSHSLLIVGEHLLTRGQ